MSNSFGSRGFGSRLTRRSFLSAAAGIGALTLAACGGAAGASSASADSATSGADASSAASSVAPTKVSFVLDYAPNVNHTGLYVALDKGYFDEAGIELEILPVPEDGSDMLIGSGGADMGVTYQDYIANSLSSANPMPYTAIAALVQHNTSGIMSRKEDGITTAKAMEGHVYATWNLPIEQATIKQVVEADGGDFSKVKMVPYAVDDEVMGLKANMFDAVWVYEWWAVQNAKIQDYPVNYFSFKDMDPVFDFYTPVVAANDDFLAKHPETARAVLVALRKGYEFAAEHPGEAAQILCAAVPELDPSLVDAAQTAISPQYIADAPRWGDIDPKRWTRFYQWLNDKGLAEHPIKTDAGYTLEYLDSAE